MPEGKKPPAPRVGASSVTGPVMAQSWGRVTGFQAVSLKAGWSAPGASPWKKRQPVVNCWTVRGEDGAAARDGAAPVIRKTKAATAMSANLRGRMTLLRSIGCRYL